MNQKKEPIIVIILRIALGLVFIYSGLTKAIDPIGTSYTFDNYFFSFHMSFFQIFSMLAAWLQPIVECVMGVMLITKIYTKFTAWLFLLLMSFFFLLTAWLALAEHLEVKYGYNFNVVKDCGCFGSSIKLNNLETFLKNVALMVPTLVVFFYRHRIKESRLTNLGKILVIFISCCVFFTVEAHSYRHLPIVDHSDWKVGTDLTKDYVDQDLITKSVFVYKDTTTQKTVELTEEELMKLYDTEEGSAYAESLVYVEDKTDTIQKFERAENYNFTMEDSESNDLKSSLLNKNNNTPIFLLFMYDLDQVDMEGLQGEDLAKIVKYCNDNEYYFYGLTNTPRAEIDKFVKENKIPYEILCCSYYDPAKGPYFVRDAIHSSPGLIKIEKGVITGKWAWRDFDEVLE